MEGVATQEERRKQTRRKLLEAGSAVLVTQGATNFSTVAVATAAELSNGAVFNHFNTRLDLLAATVDFTLAELRESFGHAFLTLGSEPSAAELLEILWECMSMPEQIAVADVFVQARTDLELQTRLEPIVAEHHDFIRSVLSLIDGGSMRLTSDQVESISFLFIYAMVGLTVNNVVGAGIGAQRNFVELGQQLVDLIGRDAAADTEPGDAQSDRR